jgi:hypothetical protein
MNASTKINLHPLELALNEVKGIGVKKVDFPLEF